MLTRAGDGTGGVRKRRAREGVFSESLDYRRFRVEAGIAVRPFALVYLHSVFSRSVLFYLVIFFHHEPLRDTSKQTARVHVLLLRRRVIILYAYNIHHGYKRYQMRS